MPTSDPGVESRKLWGRTGPHPRGRLQCLDRLTTASTERWSGWPPAASTSKSRTARGRSSRWPPARTGTRSWPGRSTNSGAAASSAWPVSPGSSARSPIQNVGAYGSEVSQLIASVRTWDRVDRSAGHLRRGGLRLRVPHLTLQGRAESLPDRRRHVPASTRIDVGAHPLPRARAHPRCGGGRTGARGSRPAGRPRPAARQGDGPRRGRLRQLECRFLLPQPDPGA